MEAIKGTGNSYDEIGKLYDEQPKMDWERLGDMLHIHKGIITSFPDILTIHKVIIFIRHLFLIERFSTINLTLF